MEKQKRNRVVYPLLMSKQLYTAIGDAAKADLRTRANFMRLVLSRAVEAQQSQDHSKPAEVKNDGQ